MNRISHKKQLILAFFVGAATTNIAFDVVDYVFYQASAGNVPLSPQQQAYLFAWFGAIYYGAFFVLGYVLFKYTKVGALFPLYVYIASVIAALYLTVGLPQAQNNFFIWTALLGTAVTVGIFFGIRREVRR